MGRKRGVRLQIEYVKRDGRTASFWTDAPETWASSRRRDAEEWVSSTAARHCPGATNARIINQERSS